MTSAIDTTKPTTGNPTTQSVRNNFAAAKAEIEALQAQLAARAITTVFAAAEGAEQDFVTAAQTGDVTYSTRYLIRCANNACGSVTFHPSGNTEFFSTPLNTSGASQLQTRIFRHDASGFGVQLRTIDLATGAITITMEKIREIQKVLL